jgi:hypothetical protein
VRTVRNAEASHQGGKCLAEVTSGKVSGENAINDTCTWGKNMICFVKLISLNQYCFIRTIILHVVLYGCETWSLTVREECRLRVFENRVLRRKFGSTRDEVNSGV